MTINKKKTCRYKVNGIRQCFLWKANIFRSEIHVYLLFSSLHDSHSFTFHYQFTHTHTSNLIQYFFHLFIHNYPQWTHWADERWSSNTEFIDTLHKKWDSTKWKKWKKKFHFPYRRLFFPHNFQLIVCEYNCALIYVSEFVEVGCNIHLYINGFSLSLD